MKPHKPVGYVGFYEKSKRGNWFEGRQWALCWCRLSQSAKVHRLAGTRKGRVS